MKLLLILIAMFIISACATTETAQEQAKRNKFERFILRDNE